MVASSWSSRLERWHRAYVERYVVGSSSGLHLTSIGTTYFVLLQLALELCLVDFHTDQSNHEDWQNKIYLNQV